MDEYRNQGRGARERKMRPIKSGMQIFWSWPPRIEPECVVLDIEAHALEWPCHSIHDGVAFGVSPFRESVAYGQCELQELSEVGRENETMKRFCGFDFFIGKPALENDALFAQFAN